MGTKEPSWNLPLAKESLLRAKDTSKFETLKLHSHNGPLFQLKTSLISSAGEAPLYSRNNQGSTPWYEPDGERGVWIGCVSTCKKMSSSNFFVLKDCIIP